MAKSQLIAMLMCSPIALVGATAQAQEESTPTAASAPEDNAAADSGGLADIVVTARRRAEPLQQTPLAVSAVDPARLSEAHVTNVSQLTTLVPNISLEKATNDSGALFAYIRGFGTSSTDPGAEPAVSINVDGIYQGLVTGSAINLFDVETVEVLRGPQGTLLGKNSPAGGINVRTRRPKNAFGGMFQVDYGRFDNFQIRTFIDVPVVADKLAMTASYFRETSDGYVRDIPLDKRINGLRNQTFRIAALATPSDGFTWYLSSQYDTNKSEIGGFRNVSTPDRAQNTIPTASYGAVPPSIFLVCTAADPAISGSCNQPNLNFWTTEASARPRRDDIAWNLTSDMAIEAGPVNVALVTGYRYFRERNYPDVDGIQPNAFDQFYGVKARQFSNEVRLASSEGGGLDMDGRLNWLVGAYYFWLDYSRLVLTQTLGAAPTPTFQSGQTNSFALFAHAEYKVTDELVVSGGVRQTWDRRTHNYRNATAFRNNTPEVPERGNWDNLSVDATVEYHFTPHQMFFVRYAQGYRGGGFTGVPASAAVAGAVNPETVDAFEAGLKADFFDRRARINISAFRSKYKDLQRVIVISDPNPPFFLQKLLNVAKATTQGVEVEMQARPIEALTLRANVAYLDAHYDDYLANLTSAGANGPTDNSALSFPYTSKWTYQIGGTYNIDLDDSGVVSLTADYAHRSTLHTTDANYGFGRQKGYGLLSATIGWRDAADRFSVSVYGQNLTNQKYINFGSNVGGVVAIVGDGMPRTWGVSAGVKF